MIMLMVETIDHKAYLVWFDTETQQVVKREPKPSIVAAHQAMMEAVKRLTAEKPEDKK